MKIKYKYIYKNPTYMVGFFSRINNIKMEYYILTKYKLHPISNGKEIYKSFIELFYYRKRKDEYNNGKTNTFD